MKISVICHGFTSNPAPSEKPTFDVLQHRLQTVKEVIEKFQSIAEIEVIFTDEEASGMYAYYEDQMEAKFLESESITVKFEAQSTNTFENVQYSCESLTNDIVIPVTSKDHAGRCLYLWTEALKDTEKTVLMASSAQQYASTGTDTVFIEPSKLEPIADVLGDCLEDLDSEEYADFASFIRPELEDSIQKYKTR